ncbi:Aste57867_24072 [Aphanomyces stellatus]|uniref:Aste57867_24072 protein n=1 Tax=Aphanomyces stellatus TaxID=120398 RepID=A0A485LPF5_9STRA|nr:hypothetical protein As57867_023999 [Aphanomyces stellatus]VFU00715.1 Aste57867_24072 [Aphanomyces stellatus]
MSSTSVDVTFPSHDGSLMLAGTVTTPTTTTAGSDSLRPAVVIIVGTGRIDRNGRTASGIETCVYSKLASLFTDELGWVCLRYDKRGTGASTNSDNDLYLKAGMSDLVRDAAAAAQFLLTRPHVDPTKLILAGHSEGSILLPSVSLHLGTVHGLFFIAGFGESIETAVRWQSREAAAAIAASTSWSMKLMQCFMTEAALLKEIDDRKAKVAATEGDMISEWCGLVKTQAKWWREHFAYDVPRLHADSSRLTSHALIVTGAKDVQCRAQFCTIEHAKTVLTHAASVTCAVPTKMTHLLRPMEGTPEILTCTNEYKRTAHEPLDLEFVQAIREWARAIGCE